MGSRHPSPGCPIGIQTAVGQSNPAGLQSQEQYHVEAYSIMISDLINDAYINTSIISTIYNYTQLCTTMYSQLVNLLNTECLVV